MTQRTPQWIVLSVALMACSSEPSNTGVGAPSGGPIPIDRLDEEAIRAQCDLLFRCCDTSKLFVDAPGATRAQCDALIHRDVAKGILKLQAAVADGKASYDGAAARKCLDAVAAQPCDGQMNDPACDAVTRGTLPDGQACDADRECVSGFCMRTCQRRPSVGEACAGFFCAPGGYCDRMTFKCAAQKPAGSACEASGECVSGNCDSKSTCAASIPDGAPCTSSSACVSGLCNSSGTCGPNGEGLCYAR